MADKVSCITINKCLDYPDKCSECKYNRNAVKSHFYRNINEPEPKPKIVKRGFWKDLFQPEGRFGD